MSDPGLTSSSLDDQPTVKPNVLAVSGRFDPAQPCTEIWMEGGGVVRVPTSVLLQAYDTQKTSDELVRDDPSDSTSSTIIPVVEERLTVEKRIVPTGTIRLRKTVQEYTEALDETLAIRTFDVERRVLNQPVDVAPPVRQEGNTTVYSLVEEQMVLTKQLVLREEVRVVQRDTERRDTQTVTLHKEHLSIERSDVK